MKAFSPGDRVRLDPDWRGTAERIALGLPGATGGGTVTKLLNKSDYHAPDTAWVEWDDGNRRPEWLGHLVSEPITVEVEA
jgi:hypothetical protein